MDAPLAAAIHKENVHIIGGEKDTIEMKPDKLKTAGKKRKASADLSSTYIPVAGASKDVDLKQKSARKGNKIKKNQMTQGKQHAAAADRTTKKHRRLTDKEIRQCCEWPNHILTDEEIKKIRKWSKYGIGKAFREDFERQPSMNPTISEMIASLMDIPIPKLEQPFLSDEEGNKTDGFDFDCFKFVPGPYYTPEEQYDSLDKVEMVIDEYPFPELKLDDD